MKPVVHLALLIILLLTLVSCGGHTRQQATPTPAVTVKSSTGLPYDELIRTGFAYVNPGCVHKVAEVEFTEDFHPQPRQFVVVKVLRDEEDKNPQHQYNGGFCFREGNVTKLHKLDDPYLEDFLNAEHESYCNGRCDRRDLIVTLKEVKQVFTEPRK